MTKLSSFWVTSKRTSRILSAAAHAAVLKPHTAWPQFNSSPTTGSSASTCTRVCPSHSDLSTSTVTHLIKNCTQKCSKGLRISGICRQCPSGGKSKSFHSPLGVYWDRRLQVVKYGQTKGEIEHRTSTKWAHILAAENTAHLPALSPLSLAKGNKNHW